MTDSVEISRLARPTRQRLAELLAGKVIIRARESAGAGIAGAVVMLLLIGGAVALLVLLNLGVVDSGKPAHPIIGALGWGVVAAALWWTVAGMVRSSAALRGGLPGGFHILSEGALEVRAGRVRVVNAARIERWELRAEATAGASGLRLFHIDLVLDDGSRAGTVMFGTQLNVPHGELDALVDRGKAIREGRGDLPALVPEAELEAARRGATAGRRRGWVAPVGAGVVGAAAAWLVLLPQLSLGKGRTSHWIGVWDAVARSHPLPWVRAEADRARLALRQQARAQVMARLRPPWNERIGPLLDAAMATPDRRLVVRELTPSPEEVEAANKKLTAMAPAGTTPAPILLSRVSTSLSARTDPAAVAFAGALHGALGLDSVAGALSIGAEDPPLADVPRIELGYTIDVQSVLAGDGERVFAALGLTFTARAVLPGAPPIPLGEPITIPAPASMQVLRTDVGNLRKRSLDSTGVYAIDAIEDSLVYVEMIEKAATQAAGDLMKQIGAS